MKRLFKNFKIVALLVALFCVNAASAQSREYVRKAIEEWGECRNVAITESNGDLALYQQNGYVHSDCPADLDKAIAELHKKGEYIDDVQLTESGKWLILYGNNGFLWNDIPASLETKLKEFNNEGEVITSATFNDGGEWIVITTNYYAASSPEIEKVLKEGNDAYGQIWAACVTDESAVIVFEEGYKFIGEISEGLQKALDNTELNVYRLKISGDAWFFADKDGAFEYDM